MSEFEGFGEDSVEEPHAGADEEASELPPLMRASDLLPPEPELPSEPPDEDTPPDESAPTFIYSQIPGASRPSVKLASGTPVGVWLDQEHHDLDGEGVWSLLTGMGMEDELALWYGGHRDKARVAREELAVNPAVARSIREEARRLGDKERIQAAFIKAQKEKK